MRHPSDERWGLQAPDYRPSIAVIEAPPGTRRPQPAGKVNRVPFGFARVLVDRGLCGHLHPRHAGWGGCSKALGHEGAHKWNPHDPAPVRPGPLPDLPIDPRPRSGPA